MSEINASGTFEVKLVPSEGVLPDTGRFDFTKTWTGDITGSSQGVMLSAGDPANGTAGYVALETFTGSISGLTGSVVLQQYGTMLDGTAQLQYEVAPGSGTAELSGLTGVVDLTMIDGVHHVALRLTKG